LGRPKRGANIFVTIDPNLQEVARSAMGANEGAVVAMDPRSGDILALYSTPGFDPSELSSGSDPEIRAAWKRLTADPDNPLLALSHQELFLPGSSFKIVTASAALENGLGPDRRWPNPHRLTLPLTNEQLQNFGDDHCNGGSSQITMIEAFEESCNVTFAEVGLRLGPERLAAQARAYGLCGTIPPERTTCDEEPVRFELPFENGRFPEPAYFERNDPLLAFSAIGLDNDLVNPLQMALIASAVANDGIVPQPRIVTEVRDSQGRVAREFGEGDVGRAISESAAATLTRMMIAVVNEGSGYLAAIPGIQVAGKTGTAQSTPDRPPYAWFVSFAPAIDPQVAVCVLVEASSTPRESIGGNFLGAPIAKSVMEAVLQ
jgi:peptidoglycan glycosyltransferase